MSTTIRGGVKMARRDGTGPLGRGAMTGRGLGICSGVNAVRYGAGFGAGLGLGYACRRGMGMGLGRGLGLNYVVDQPQSNLTQKELLMEQKELLANRLDIIDKELENLSDS